MNNFPVMTLHVTLKGCLVCLYKPIFFVWSFWMSSFPQQDEFVGANGYQAQWIFKRFRVISAIDLGTNMGLFHKLPSETQLAELPGVFLELLGAQKCLGVLREQDFCFLTAKLGNMNLVCHLDPFLVILKNSLAPINMGVLHLNSYLKLLRSCSLFFILIWYTEIMFWRLYLRKWRHWQDYK